MRVLLAKRVGGYFILAFSFAVAPVLAEATWHLFKIDFFKQLKFRISLNLA